MSYSIRLASRQATTSKENSSTISSVRTFIVRMYATVILVFVDETLSEANVITGFASQRVCTSKAITTKHVFVWSSIGGFKIANTKTPKKMTSQYPIKPAMIFSIGLPTYGCISSPDVPLNGSIHVSSYGR